MDNSTKKNRSVCSDLHNVTREDQKIPPRNCFSTSKAYKIPKYDLPSKEEIVDEWNALLEQRRMQYELDEQNLPSDSDIEEEIEKTENKSSQASLISTEPLKAIHDMSTTKNILIDKHIQKLNLENSLHPKLLSIHQKTKVPMANEVVKARPPLSGFIKKPAFKPLQTLTEKKTTENTKNYDSTNALDMKLSSLSLNAPINHDKCITSTPCIPKESKNKENFPKRNESGKSEPKIQFSLDARSILNMPTYKRPTSPQSANLCTDIDQNLSRIKQFSDKEIKSWMIKHLKVQEVVKTLTVHQTEYMVLNMLGKGGSSKVFHCYEPKSREEFAIKCVDLIQESSNLSGLLKEVDLLKKLQNCDRIVKLHNYELCHERKKLLVVLEKGGKDFSQILREYALKKTHVPEFLVIYYWMQMLYAVKQIHERGIVHSDLKPSNFLLSYDRMKLIDFGISCCVDKNMTSAVKNVALGTFSYISPEALCSEHSSNIDSPNFGKDKYKLHFKSDVWSLGCILYQLVYGRTPFAHIAHSGAKLLVIMDPKHVIDYPAEDRVSSKHVRVMQACLQYNVKARPSVDDLIKQYERLIPMS